MYCYNIVKVGFVFVLLILFTEISTVISIEIYETESDDSTTAIEGLYYLRDDDPLDWADVGSLLRSLPFENEFTSCGMFINFHFTQEGIYIGEYTIYNIYYHLWQKSYLNNGKFEIGYSTSKEHTAGFDEYILVDTNDYISKVNDYLLVTTMQYTNPEIAFFIDEDIYNFTIKSYGPTPNILCNPSQYSFVILNLEDNATLKNYDRDYDLINDYEELFVFYTNPFDSDTDNDGYSDFIEINSGNNPNDFNDHTVSNSQPNVPSIMGPSNGKRGEKYDYRFVSTDPEGDNLYYYIDWGDEQIEEWIGQYGTGEVLNIGHIWEEEGRYKIKAKVKDIYGAQSDWKTFNVSMLKNKATYNTFFLRFLERFPLFEKLLFWFR